MEGRKFGFRIPANDNFTEAELRRGVEAVTPIPVEQKNREESPDLDPAKVTSLRSLLGEIRNANPLSVSHERIEALAKELGPQSPRSIVRALNASSEDDWRRQPAFFALLLKELYEPSLREVSDE